MALVWTLAAKGAIAHSQQPDRPLAGALEAGLADIVFFASVAASFALAHLVTRRPAITRSMLLVAAVALGWSVMNAAWLFATGVQLQPGVVMVLARDPVEFWPVVRSHLAANPLYAVPISATAATAAAWFLWRLVRPGPVPASRRLHGLRLATAAALTLAAGGALVASHSGGRVTYSDQALGFSSHWHAIMRVAGAVSRDDVGSDARRLPRIGERDVTPPAEPRELPNVVVVLLESVSFDATSLAHPARDTTPNLAALAGEGAHFVSTRVPAPQTTKAFWSTFTGTTPIIQRDSAEAVLVDEPYESLASLLSRTGYRSAFFEMSRGSFECAPGLFANLAFDWAWFRENLEDESAHLGYMNGDDFRMLDPMFEWVDSGDEPFLLGTITSVAHDPYALPAWFDRDPPDDRYERYLRAVTYSDAFLGELCRRLERRGLTQRTLLCVIGDHGDSFRPETPRGRWVPFEEVIRVPWVVRWPRRVAAGREVTWPCSQLDVTPTLLSLIGYDVADAGFEGRDALRPAPADRPLFFSTWAPQGPLGVVEGTRKFVYWTYTDKLFEYDLVGDPEERAPRIVEGPPKARRAARLRQWKEASELEIPPRRFRQRLLYDHWRTFSSGRSAWAYYVP